MTKRMAVALVLVFGAAEAVSAQSVTARANVPTMAAFAGTPRDLIFPAGTPGAAGTGVAVTGAMTAASATGQLGYHDVRLNYGTATVSVPNTLVLASAATPTNTLDATISCGVGATGAASVTLADCAAATSLGYTGPGLETRRVFIGGGVSQAEIDAAVPAADYTGTITITLTP